MLPGKLLFLILTILRAGNVEDHEGKLRVPKIDVLRTKSEGHKRSPKLTPENHGPFSKTDPDQNSNCFHIPAPATICPEGFTLLARNQENMCYIITEHQEFPPLCPYPNFLPYHRIRRYLQSAFYDRILWVHAFRNAGSGFPDFEFVENGSHREQVTAENLTNPNDIYNKNCLVSRNGHLLRVSCSRRYGSLCMYSMKELHHSNLEQLCDNSGHLQCIFAHYDLARPSCFCKKLDRAQPPRKEFCQKLAEPVAPFQSELMAKYFDTDSSTCWIGLHEEELGSKVHYKWSSTNESVGYTRWARPEDCRSSEGAFKFNIDPYGGWSLTRDRTLKCAICESATPVKECTLQLQYVTHKNEIELVIHNYPSISTSHGLNLYCFSDSNSDGFKDTVPFILDNMEQHKARAIVKLATVANHPSYYWCEAFQYFSSTPINSNVIWAYDRINGYGNEFSILVSATISLGIDPFLNKIHLQVLQLMETKINDHHIMVQSLRPMRAYFEETKHRMGMLVHLTTQKTTESATDQFTELFGALNSISITYPTIKLITFLGSEVCLVSFTSTPDNLTLEWPETRIGAKAIPRNVLCLDETQHMIPVTRKCGGDFLYGARWEDPVGTCRKSTEYSETTKELFNLVVSDTSAEKITTDLNRITQEHVVNQPIDVHLMANILERLVVEFRAEVDNGGFLQIISNIMGFDRNTVKEAQSLLNSTDKILSALDDFLNSEGTIFMVTSRLIIQITDLKTNITGTALYTTRPDSYGFEFYTVTQLFQNTSFDSLVEDEHLETAVLLPADILKNMESEGSSNQPTKLIIAVFYNDLLFNEQNLDLPQQSKTKIISASISGFAAPLDSSIRIAFKLPKCYLNTKNCSHWNYGLDTNMISVHGRWESDEPSRETASLVEICEFLHMTHFGLLLQGKPIEGQQKRSLEVLIAVGSALSLAGIFPIFFTACLFRSWRCRSGNIILLHFCFAITLQILLTFLLPAVGEDGVPCTILGASLHYMDLSEFCWMFVIALLQYRRFVTVFKPEQKFLVGKCLLFGWVTPLIPVVITICVSPSNYRLNSADYCYVVENYFLYGCLMPIAIILCSNAVIFVAIMYSISRQNVAVCLQRSDNYKLEILLALFLFFTLGMTWIFCLVALLGGGILFTYLFCATATLRGLVLFLFFILGNKEIRQLWKKRFSYYVSKNKQESGGPRCSTTGTLSSDGR